MKGMKQFRDGAMKIASEDKHGDIDVKKLSKILDEVMSSGPQFWGGVKAAIPDIDKLPLDDFSDALHVWLLQDLSDEEDSTTEGAPSALASETQICSIPDKAAVSEQLNLLSVQWLTEVESFLKMDKKDKGLAILSDSRIKLDSLVIKASKLEGVINTYVVVRILITYVKCGNCVTRRGQDAFVWGGGAVNYVMMSWDGMFKRLCDGALIPYARTLFGGINARRHG